MRLAIHECKHCGDEYTHQWSGNYDAVDTPKEYRDQDYCPECKKAIVEALKEIPVKFKYEFADTDEVDLDTLERWEKEFWEEARVQGKLYAKRVFASLFNWDKQESQKTEQVIGREDKKGRIYIYSYWPSKRDEYTIRVEKRKNLITGELGKYKIVN